MRGNSVLHANGEADEHVGDHEAGMWSVNNLNPSPPITHSAPVGTSRTRRAVTSPRGACAHVFKADVAEAHGGTQYLALAPRLPHVVKLVRHHGVVTSSSCLSFRVPAATIEHACLRVDRVVARACKLGEPRMYLVSF